jgi:branched-chain amino acid transport system permease protein
MGAAGAFYVQVFQYIDPAIAFGAHTVGGGAGGRHRRRHGHAVGAGAWARCALHVLADLTRNLFGQLPGINMVIYGTVLVLIVMFAPRGLAGVGQSVRQLWKGRP